MNTNLQITGTEFSITCLINYLDQMSDVTIGKTIDDGAKTVLPITVPFDCVQYTKYVADKYGCVARWVRGKAK